MLLARKHNVDSGFPYDKMADCVSCGIFANAIDCLWQCLWRQNFIQREKV